MNNRLMVRLIDVALIILLGFIAISRLKTEYVDLPAAGSNEPINQSIHEAQVHVYKTHFKFDDHAEQLKCATVEELEKVLIRENQKWMNRRVKLIVNIEPHKSSIMQRFVDVLDICQRNHIEKKLNYESTN